MKNKFLKINIFVTIFLIIIISIGGVIKSVEAAPITDIEAAAAVDAMGINFPNTQQGQNERALAIAVYQKAIRDDKTVDQATKIMAEVVKEHHQTDLNRAGTWQQNSNGDWEFNTTYLNISNPGVVTSTSCGEEGLQGVDFLVFHGPLVPCGVEKKCDTSGMSAEAKKQIESINKTCTLCHFIILIKNIFDLLLSLIITVSLLMLTIAGVLYIISSGGAMTSLAKGIIQKTLLGFGIFLLSWLIVYTVLNLLSVRTGENGGDGMIGKGTADSWFQFTCDTESSFDKDLLEGGNTGTGGQQGGNTGTGGQQGGNIGTGGQQGGNIGTQPGTNNGGNPNIEAESTSTDEGQARASLFEDSGGNISVWESRTGATNVRDLRPTTRQGVIGFQREVGNPITITGGAESGYHANDGTGGYTHQNGYKVDIEDTPAVNNYIENHYDYVGYRSGNHGGRIYTDRHGNYYTREDTHWDVCYNCPSPVISTLH